MPLFSIIIWICFSIKGVITNPGHIALHVTPSFAFSRATTLVNPTTPNLEAQQADLLGEATNPWALAMLMILPHFLCFIPGKASAMVQKLELRFRAITLSHWASGKSSVLSMCCIPALLTKMSTFPKWAIDFLTKSLLSAGLVRSAKMNLAWELAEVKAFSVLAISSSGAKPLRTTLAPQPANAWAIPKPIPERDPVTTAVLPFNISPNILSLFLMIMKYLWNSNFSMTQYQQYILSSCCPTTVDRIG